MTAIKRKLLIGGSVASPKLRLRNEGASILRVRNQVEEKLIENGFLESAPFESVSIILRFGEVHDLEPKGWDISNRNKELRLAVELNGHEVKAMQGSPSLLDNLIKVAIIEVLCDVAANYDLPYKFLDEMRPAQSK